MDDETHVGLVDPHAEGDRGHDDIRLLHQEGVLVPGTGGGIHPRMIRQRLDAVGHEQFGQLLDLFAAQAIDDARLALMLFDVPDDLAGDVGFGTYLIEKVGTVERRLEYRRIEHPEVLLYVELHLGRGGGRKGDQRRPADVVHDGPDTPVLRTEIVPPLRDAVRLVDRVERYFDLAQERNVLLLGQRFGREIKQLGLAGKHILLHLVDRRLIERRVQEMGDAFVLTEGTHGIHLILHERNERGDHDRHTLHQKGRQLVAQTLTAARRHEDERVPACEYISYDRFLIALERRKPEILLQLFMQHVMQIVHLPFNFLMFPTRAA